MRTSFKPTPMLAKAHTAAQSGSPTSGSGALTANGV